MLIKIAWRNIWRNRGRSLVVIGSFVVGIWALILSNGFMNGFMVSYSAGIINNDISNIQIHNPEFKQDLDIKFTLNNGTEKATAMRSWEGVFGTTTRSITTGMIASTKKAAGVQIRGIDIENEANVTRLDSMIFEGAYFEGIKRNPIIIGTKLAENLNVKLRSKVVLTFNDANGDITSGAFRVVGIVKSASLNISQLYAYVKQDDLNKLLGIGQEIHEIAIITDPKIEENTIVSKYQSIHDEDLIETWREISPELAFMEEMYGSMLFVLMGIILTALVFGIVNTMLMSVLERTRELGVLMAVGMNRARIYIMIMLETIFLGITGAPIGLLMGWLTITVYQKNGLDLSKYSEGLESFGYSSMLYPFVSAESYWIVTIGVIITAVVGALYPAWKATKLKPVEAIHTI